MGSSEYAAQVAAECDEQVARLAEQERGGPWAYTIDAAAVLGRAAAVLHMLAERPAPAHETWEQVKARHQQRLRVHRALDKFDPPSVERAARERAERERDELLRAVRPVLSGDGVLGDVLRDLRLTIERIEADDR